MKTAFVSKEEAEKIKQQLLPKLLIFEDKNVIINMTNGEIVNSPFKISNHTIERALERGVSTSDIKDTLEHSLHIKDIKTDDNGNRSAQIIGERATVAINPDTSVVTTTWKTGKNTVKRYKKGD